MASKEEVIQYIKTLGEQKLLTKEELNAAFDSGIDSTATGSAKKAGIAEVLYYIGGAIVFLGISILLWENWNRLDFLTRILATLGSGLAAYLVGLLFSRVEKTETVGSAFYLISALVTPIGLSVVIDNAGFNSSSHGSLSLISGVMMGTYLLSLLVYRKTIFVLFSILFGTWFFFSFTSFLIGDTPYFDRTFYEYRVLLAGIAYMCLGYTFSKNQQFEVLQGFLYGFGILGFLGAALALGDWSPNQNVLWELIYPGLVFGTLFISVQIKNKSFLIWGTVFLMLYILKITAEYFTNSLGWPLALVIAGLAMIGVGYMSITLKKKYSIA